MTSKGREIQKISKKGVCFYDLKMLSNVYESIYTI